MLVRARATTAWVLALLAHLTLQDFQHYKRHASDSVIFSRQKHWFELFWVQASSDALEKSYSDWILHDTRSSTQLWAKSLPFGKDFVQGFESVRVVALDEVDTSRRFFTREVKFYTFKVPKVHDAPISTCHKTARSEAGTLDCVARWSRWFCDLLAWSNANRGWRLIVRSIVNQLKNEAMRVLYCSSSRNNSKFAEHLH